MVYSLVLMSVMSVVSLLLFYFMLGWPLEQAGLFLGITLTGSLSLSVVFTFLSAIAARAQQNAALMAILGFPLVTPLLMILSKLSLKALGTVYMPGWWSLAVTLLSLDALVIILGLLLFPFLWQE
jgi:heme exporter protein B